MGAYKGRPPPSDGSVDPVTAPADTSDPVAAGANPSGHTFGAFTDPGGRIASYAKAEIDTVGASSWTGSALGAYTISGSANGDNGSLTLTALDSSGDPLTTAVHTWSIAAATPAAVTAPAATTDPQPSGGTPSAKTFSAFTDPDSRIASYSATTTNAVGAATWTGTGLGAYTVGSSADGDSGTLALEALDSGGNPLQTAYHSWDIAVATGGAWTDLVDLDLTGLDTATLTGTTIVNKSAVQYGPACKVVDFGGNGGTVSAGASGVTVQGGSANGSLNYGFDLSSYIDFAKNFYLPIRFDIVCAGLVGWTGTTDAWQAGVIDSSVSFSAAVQERSVRANYSSGVNQSRVTSKNNTSAAWATEAIPAGAWVSTIVIYRGVQYDAGYTLGSTPPTDATINAGLRIFGGTSGTASTPDFPSAIWVGVRSIFRPGFTISRIRARALR